MAVQGGRSQTRFKDIVMLVGSALGAAVLVLGIAVALAMTDKTGGAKQASATQAVLNDSTPAPTQHLSATPGVAVGSPTATPVPPGPPVIYEVVVAPPNSSPPRVVPTPSVTPVGAVERPTPTASPMPPTPIPSPTPASSVPTPVVTPSPGSSQSTTSDFQASCVVPLAGSEEIGAHVEAFFPQDVARNAPTGIATIDVVVILPSHMVDALNMIGAAEVSGGLTLNLNVAGLTDPLPMTTRLGISPTFVPPTGTVALEATGQVPSFSFAQSGVVTFWLETVGLSLDAHTADGSAITGIDLSAIRCALAAAPVSIARMQVS